MMIKIVVGVLGLVAGVTATPLEIVERSSCRDDSLYKCFADYEYAHSASAYCSALAPCTKTVTAVKPTVTKTVWKTHTAATSTCLIKSTTTVYTRTIPSSTVVKTSTVVETKTSTATATVTADIQRTGPSKKIIEQVRRAAGGGKPQPPKCMLNKCFAYTPERITAACSCINVPPKTITVTHTACSSTKTVTSTSTTTPKVTATSWHTVATASTNGVTTTCTTTTITTTATTTTTTTTTLPVTLPYTTPATTPATTPPTTPPTIPPTTPPTTTPTTTPTTPITTAAATTSSSAPNLIPDGDFSSGLSPWTQINSSPTSWLNANVGMNNSPDGDSPDFSVTNIAASGLFFLSSASFLLQSSSTYTFTFYVANTATDPSWTSQVLAQVACGSYSLGIVDMTKATLGPNNYMASSTTFNTPTDTSPLTLQQLGNCQAQIVFHSGVQQHPNTWFLAKVGVSYVGPMAPASPPPTSVVSVVP